jgi:hypothetical protein
MSQKMIIDLHIPVNKNVDFKIKKNYDHNIITFDCEKIE